MSFLLRSPEDVSLNLAERARDRRLILNLSQEGLAHRAGISTGTVKRFEKTGQISIASLLQIALILDALEEFDTVFKPKDLAPASINDIINEPRKPKRGRLK